MRFVSKRYKLERYLVLSLSAFVVASVSLTWLPALFAQAKLPRANSSSAQARGKLAWCRAAVSQPVPSGPVAGTIGGQPFRPDVVQWNSYSVTLKQSRTRYCKVVVNMMKRQKPLCNIAFTSESNKLPRISVYSRASNSEPVLEQHYINKDGYGLQFRLLSPIGGGRIPGAMLLRLPDGSFVAGTFEAEKAPRIIWDDQAVDSK